MKRTKRTAKRLTGALLVAVCLLALVATLHAASAVVAVDNSGKEADSGDYYASANEFMDTSYTSGDASRVYGSGEISTHNSQSWTLYATDGAKRNGEIVGADLPVWFLQVYWNCDLAVDAGANNGGSTHRANAGQWGAVLGDLTGFDGNDYDVWYQHSNPSSSYTGSATIEGGSYNYTGKKKYDGGFTLVPTGSTIVAGVNLYDVALFETRIYNRGWMTLNSNGDTTSVEAELNDYAGSWSGYASAWDFGPDPAVWLEYHTVS
ncbi:MAG: hypothetical protein R3E76_01400 [Planctomycetota bacterium]